MYTIHTKPARQMQIQLHFYNNKFTQAARLANNSKAKRSLIYMRKNVGTQFRFFLLLTFLLHDHYISTGFF